MEKGSVKKGSRTRGESSGRQGEDPFDMLFEEFKHAYTQLLVVAEASTEEGKSEATYLTCLYLVEYVRRFKSPGMTREKTRAYALTATQKLMRQRAPHELADLLKEGEFNVQTTERMVPSVSGPQPQSVESGGVPSVPGPTLQPGAGDNSPSVPESPTTDERVEGNPFEESGDAKPPDQREEVAPTFVGSSVPARLPWETDGPEASPKDEGPEPELPVGEAPVGDHSPAGGPEGGGGKTMSEWERANTGKTKVKLPDGTEIEIEDIHLPDRFQEKELSSNVRGGGVSHVPRDTRMLPCPKCKMDKPEYLQKCGACGHVGRIISKG
jgi:hypothetical protein